MSRSRSTPRCTPASLVLAGTLAALLAGLAFPQAASFHRGDSNLDGRLDVSDGIFTMRVMFLGEPPAGCDDAADVDDDGLLSITDGIFGMRFLFLDGPPPPAPFGECGPDPTEDGLTCQGNPQCAEAPQCLSQAQIDGLLGDSTAFTFCLPAGAIDLPVDPFQVSVCPAADAKPCGPTEAPGCPVDLTSVTATLDAAARRVVVRFEGRVTDLPIAVTESLFNTTTTCLTDFHGADAEKPFSFGAVIPLVVEEAGAGVLRITGTGEGTIENVDLALTSAGGVVCRLFQAGQAGFINLLVAPLEAATKSISESLGQQLVGMDLCLER